MALDKYNLELDVLSYLDFQPTGDKVTDDNNALIADAWIQLITKLKAVEAAISDIDDRLTAGGL